MKQPTHDGKTGDLQEWGPTPPGCKATLLTSSSSVLLPRSPPPRPCTLPNESGANPNVRSLRSSLGWLGPCWPASTRTPADPRHRAWAHRPPEHSRQHPRVPTHPNTTQSVTRASLQTDGPGLSARWELQDLCTEKSIPKADSS